MLESRLRWAVLSPSFTSRFHARTKSFAVTGFPLLHLAFLRRLKVHVLKSSLAVQLSAIPGISISVAGSVSVRPSYKARTTSVSGGAEASAGSKLFGNRPLLQRNSWTFCGNVCAKKGSGSGFSSCVQEIETITEIRRRINRSDPDRPNSPPRARDLLLRSISISTSRVPQFRKNDQWRESFNFS